MKQRMRKIEGKLKYKEMYQVNKNVDIIREFRGLTKRDLAKLMGVSGENVGQKISGRRSLNVTQLLKYAKHLNVPVQTFFCDLELLSERKLTQLIDIWIYMGKHDTETRIEIFKLGIAAYKQVSQALSDKPPKTK